MFVQGVLLVLIWDEVEQRESTDWSNILKVTAIVPAYNEGQRLSRVLDAISSASLVEEIIVVNDGSTDNTSEVASSFPEITLINLTENTGKGGAMHAGATACDADVVLFLDADLIGITGEQIDSIIRPVVEEQTQMCIGVFRGGRSLTDFAQFMTPYISGQRAMLRNLFLQMPDVEYVRSGVEVAITKHFRSNHLTFSTVILTGCTHPMKEEKLGLFPGFVARMGMYCDIGRIMLNGHPQRNGHGRVARRILELVKRKVD
jgi:polyisoprenyl-phosphate glycosyltransferase